MGRKLADEERLLIKDLAVPGHPDVRPATSSTALYRNAAAAFTRLTGKKISYETVKSVSSGAGHFSTDREPTVTQVQSLVREIRAVKIREAEQEVRLMYPPFLERYTRYAGVPVKSVPQPFRLPTPAQMARILGRPGLGVSEVPDR